MSEEVFGAKAMVATEDRYQGALLGLAVGDALGAAVEFESPGCFKPVTEMRGGGPFRLKPGYWTDDTSLAMCLAESLVECNFFDPVDQLTRYCQWWRKGYWSSTGKCFDIGMTTRAALATFEKTGEPFCGDTSDTSAGNGSLMRLAPVPLLFANSPDQALDYAGRSSMTTHGAEAAVDACRYFAGLIVGAVQGADKQALLSPSYAPADDYWQHNPLVTPIAEVAEGSFLRKEPPEIKGAGYVVQSLEAALWAFAKSDNFRDGCLLAVNLGDDADTTGAIYGQIAGAYYGASAIPPEWRDKIVRKDDILALAMKLHARRR